MTTIIAFPDQRKLLGSSPTKMAIKTVFCEIEGTIAKPTDSGMTEYT
jgi:hypothetical protein